jgi:hypothetical protein
MSKRTIGPFPSNVQRKVLTGQSEDGTMRHEWRDVPIQVWLTYHEDDLVRTMGEKAFHNKSRICKEAGGYVVAEVREIRK